MGVPTKGETYAKLIEHVRLAQEDAAMMAHLFNAEGNAPGMVLGRGWLNVSELLKQLQWSVTELAKRGLQ